MSKGKVVLIGVVMSLFVSCMHLITLEVSTSYKNSSQSDRSNMSLYKELIQNGEVEVAAVVNYPQGHVHIAYWYSYTIYDFLIDFAVSMLVYLFIVAVVKVVRQKILNHNRS